MMIAALIGTPASDDIPVVSRLLSDRGVTMLRYAAEIHEQALALERALPGLALHGWFADDFGSGPVARTLRDRAMLMGEERSPVDLLVACWQHKPLAIVALAHAQRIRVLEVRPTPQRKLFKGEP